jgi:hypothetical protein
MSCRKEESGRLYKEEREEKDVMSKRRKVVEFTKKSKKGGRCIRESKKSTAL